jgi:very-short-patch-repair endonuclease
MTLRSQSNTFRKAYVASSAQWHAAGVTTARMRSLIRHGHLVPVRRGVYATRRAIVLRDAGYKVVHFTWRELFESPETVINRIRKALAAPTAY